MVTDSNKNKQLSEQALKQIEKKKKMPNRGAIQRKKERNEVLH